MALMARPKGPPRAEPAGLPTMLRAYLATFASFRSDSVRGGA